MNSQCSLKALLNQGLDLEEDTHTIYISVFNDKFKEFIALKFFTQVYHRFCSKLYAIGRADFI